MKVPKSIKISVFRMARHNEIVRKADAEIRDWLERNKILNDGVLDQLIDCCDLTYNPETFIEYLEALSDDDYDVLEGTSELYTD